MDDWEEQELPEPHKIVLLNCVGDSGEKFQTKGFYDPRKDRFRTVNWMLIHKVIGWVELIPSTDENWENGKLGCNEEFVLPVGIDDKIIDSLLDISRNGVKWSDKPVAKHIAFGGKDE